MNKENDNINDYVTITWEPEDYWVPREGETDEECSRRIHERIKRELGDEYEEIKKESDEMLKEFNIFIKNRV